MACCASSMHLSKAIANSAVQPAAERPMLQVEVIHGRKKIFPAEAWEGTQWPTGAPGRWAQVEFGAGFRPLRITFAARSFLSASSLATVSLNSFACFASACSASACSACWSSARRRAMLATCLGVCLQRLAMFGVELAELLALWTARLNFLCNGSQFGVNTRLTSDMPWIAVCAACSSGVSGAGVAVSLDFACCWPSVLPVAGADCVGRGLWQGGRYPFLLLWFCLVVKA
eukprot:1242441-Amphidinium_carterae.2